MEYHGCFTNTCNTMTILQILAISWLFYKYLQYHGCFTNTVKTVLSRQPKDKPKVAVYDSWLLNTDQYYLER